MIGEATIRLKVNSDTERYSLSGIVMVNGKQIYEAYRSFPLEDGDFEKLIADTFDVLLDQREAAPLKKAIK